MKPFLNQLEHQRIEHAIAEAEKTTSGEIRVMISPDRTEDPIHRAAREFSRLGMHRTAHRHGVLIFVAPNSRCFAIHGDKAIHQRCGEEFWRNVAAAMETQFREGRFTDGLVAAVLEAGRELAKHFPPEAHNPDELPNTVIDG